MKKYLLCFHDFSVWNFKKSECLIRELLKYVQKPFSILVIPDTEGASKEDIESFSETLKNLHREGFELALHGYKHKAEFSQGRNYLGLIGMNLTHGEAEFAGLSEYESERLLELGLKSWKILFEFKEGDEIINKKNENNKEAICNPVAFVPPTWYSNRFLEKQVTAKKMFYEGRFALCSAKKQRYISPVVSFAGLAPILQQVSYYFGKIIINFPFGIARIAVHPSDFPAQKNSIIDVIELAKKSGRKLVRYGDL